MKKHAILFIPSSYYLSDEAFVKIAQNSSYECIYMDPKEFNFKNINHTHREDIEKHFDRCIELAEDLYNGSNLFLRFMSYTAKKIQIILAVWRLKPTMVISTSDGIYTTRVISKFFPKIPFVVLQTALITVDADKYKSSKESQSKAFIIRWFGSLFFPFFEPIRPYGLNHPNGLVLLWGKSSERLLRSHIKNQKLHIVGNMAFEKPNDTSKPQNAVLLLAPEARTRAEALDYCEDICCIANEFSELNFAMRLHPIMDSNLYEGFFKERKTPNLKIISNLLPLKDTLLSANVVISEYSAATLDAIALDRFNILFKKDPENSALFPNIAHWFENLDIPKASSTQDVINSLKHLQLRGVFNGKSEESSKISISEHWHSIGNEARKNIMTLVDAIMKESLEAKK